KYCNGVSLTSIFYVLVASREKIPAVALDAIASTCHPVFRTRRCVCKCSLYPTATPTHFDSFLSAADAKGSSNNSANCCMIYVDEHGRVYQNWRSFLLDNQLPAGIMVTPRNGIYQLDEHGTVLLESHATPAAAVKHRVLGTLDDTATVTGLVAACVPLVGLAVGVAAPVLLVSGAMGLVSAGYKTTRSGALLLDRRRHEQSLSVRDRTARSHWIGVIAGTVGLAAAGATSTMTASSTAGRKVSAFDQLIVNSMNISTIMLSGTGLLNGVMDLFLKYQDGADISTMDVLQLSASLFIFTHSIYNFRLASSIINKTADSRVHSYREALSQSQQRIFDKLVRETTRINGDRPTQMDIIRIADEMHAHHNVSLSNTVELLYDIQNNNRNHKNTWNWAEGVSALSFSTLLINGHPWPLGKMVDSVFEHIANVEGFEQTLRELAAELPERKMGFVLHLLGVFMDFMWQALNRLLGFAITSESVLGRIGYTISNKYRQVTVQYIQDCATEILQDVKEYYISQDPNQFPAALAKCKVCEGYFSSCEL
ncbi:hypothetical protein KR222_008994, partial [Zaprionus bogoriensis]